MKTNEILKDSDLQAVMRQKAEDAERMVLSEHFTDLLMRRIHREETMRKAAKHRRWWLGMGIAASIALLVAVALQLNRPQDNSMPQQDPTPSGRLVKQDTATEDTLKRAEEKKDATSIIKDYKHIQYEAPKYPIAEIKQKPSPKQERSIRNIEREIEEVIARYTANYYQKDSILFASDEYAVNNSLDETLVDSIEWHEEPDYIVEPYLRTRSLFRILHPEGKEGVYAPNGWDAYDILSSNLDEEILP